MKDSQDKKMTSEEIGEFFSQAKMRDRIDKGKLLAEANVYADVVIKKWLFGTKRELARQRIIVMYLLDEIERLQNTLKP